MADEPETGGRRKRGAGGGAEARRLLRGSQGNIQLPYIQRKIQPYNILSEESLAIIEANADTILQDIGIEIREDPESVELFRKAGCDCKALDDPEKVRVRFPKVETREATVRD